MTEIQMTKSPRRGHPINLKRAMVIIYSENQCQYAFVLDFEHLNFGFVWSLRDFVLRAWTLRNLGRL
jgi:hypothetical protein